jgi:thiol-disulfide isomerase/thioredoxin
MKFLKWFISGMLFASIGCSACNPTPKGDDNPEETATVEAEPYPWATWEDCSQVEGDHPCNFTLQDQNGNDVSLYDFGDSGPIILDLSAMWCGPCNSAASEVQEVQDKYTSEGLTYMTVLIENYNGEAPSVADCKMWADRYGITSAPVLAGSRDMIDHSSQEGWSLSSWPTFYFITGDMVYYANMRGWSASYLDQMIQQTLAQ